jgi:hypothetical protein
MNTFNRFIITALLVFFASQAFAVKRSFFKSGGSINGRIFDAICGSDDTI